MRSVLSRRSSGGYKNSATAEFQQQKTIPSLDTPSPLSQGVESDDQRGLQTGGGAMSLAELVNLQT